MKKKQTCISSCVSSCISCNKVTGHYVAREEHKPNIDRLYPTDSYWVKVEDKIIIYLDLEK